MVNDDSEALKTLLLASANHLPAAEQKYLHTYNNTNNNVYL